MIIQGKELSEEEKKKLEEEAKKSTDTKDTKDTGGDTLKIPAWTLVWV